MEPEDLHLYDVYSPRQQNNVKALLKSADGPESTVDAIHHSLLNDKPKSRYATSSMGGIPSSIFLFLCTFLPDRVMDLLIYLGS